MSGWPYAHCAVEDDVESLILLPSPPECQDCISALTCSVYTVLGMEPSFLPLVCFTCVCVCVYMCVHMLVYKCATSMIHPSASPGDTNPPGTSYRSL